MRENKQSPPPSSDQPSRLDEKGGLAAHARGEINFFISNEKLEQKEKNHLQKVVAKAVQDNALENLSVTMLFEGREENPNDGLTEYDPRRVQPIDGVMLLGYALSSVGDRKSQSMSPGLAGMGDDDEIRAFRADTHVDAINGMRKLIQERFEQARKSWQTISELRVESGMSAVPTTRELRWRFYDGLDQEYTWYLRRSGYDLALRTLGLAVNDQGMVIPRDSVLAHEEVVEKLKQLPKRDEYRTTIQLPRVSPLA